MRPAIPQRRHRAQRRVGNRQPACDLRRNHLYPVHWRGMAPLRQLMYLDGYVTALVPSPFMEAALRAVADESRRAMLAALTEGPATAGELAALLPIARPGVSRHLRVLREAGLVEVRQDAQRRVYSLRPQPLADIDEWLGQYRALWEQRLDALHTEIARGKRERRSTR
jgi:DNA-binding transcriptional ArsR family regulator